MKKSTLLMIIVGIFFTCGVMAQTTFEHTYGGAGYDIGKSVQQTNDGGYIIAGGTRSFGPSAGANISVYLIKTDSFGDTLWTRAYGSTDEDKANSVQQTSDGGYIITGYTGLLGGDCDVYLIKTNPDGDTLWTRTYGGTEDDYGNSVQQTSDGGYIITGYTKSFGPSAGNNYSVYLIKTDASGNTLWTRTYGGADSDYGNSVQQTSDNGYIIAGYTGSWITDYDVYLIKTDASGNTLWTHTYGGADSEYSKSVQQTSDGGYIIAGYTGAFMAGYDIYLIKTDGAGNTLWTHTYDFAEEDQGNFVQQTSEDGYIIAGYTGAYPDFNVILVKTDVLGNIQWDRTFGGPNADYGNSVKQTSDGGYIIAGSYEYYFSYDVYLIKTDENGMVIDPGWITGNVYLDGGSGNVEDIEVTAGSVIVNPDVNGDYTIEIEPGTYDVIATLDCYEPDTVTDVVVIEGSTTSNIDLVLTYCVGIEKNITPAAELICNFPNPFSHTTTIKFSVENPDKNTKITIYNLNGQKIKTLVDAKKTQGVYNVIWDGTNEIGEKISPGNYFYMIKSGNLIHTRKMILIK